MKIVEEHELELDENARGNVLRRFASFSSTWEARGVKEARLRVSREGDVRGCRGRRGVGMPREPSATASALALRERVEQLGGSLETRSIRARHHGGDQPSATFSPPLRKLTFKRCTMTPVFCSWTIMS